MIKSRYKSFFALEYYFPIINLYIFLKINISQITIPPIKNESNISKLKLVCLAINTNKNDKNNPITIINKIFFNAFFLTLINVP